MTSPAQPTLALNDGAAMPQFGLGVFQTPPEATERIVRMAVGEGYRLVDTASMYRNEDGVGKALLGRTEVFVTTKLGNSDHGFDEALRAFDVSMRRLGRDRLDLFLIHWPRPRADRYVESWKALVRLQKEGRVRSIGVSNFNRDHLERIIAETGVTPAVNQVELHPRFQQKALRAFHDKRGIRTESWSPLGRGPLLGEAAIVDIAAKAQEDRGASRDPLASRQTSHRHSENGAARAPEGEHRRARLPARQGRHAAHRSARFAGRPDRSRPGDGELLIRSPSHPELAMSNARTAWESLRTNVQEHRPQLRLAVRVTIAAVLAFAASHLLHVPLPLWTVLTAVILTQVTFGWSVKATVDYLVGTVGGAIYAGAVSVMIPHADGVSLAAVLAIAVAPLAFLGATFPSFSAAPFTGVLVLLLPGFVHTGPLESAIYRVLEVTVGGVTALAVSLLVFPARAHSAAIEAAARAAELMAKSLPQLFQGFLRPLDSESITRIQDAIGEGVSQTQSIAAEARHERIVLLAADPDLRPLLRTLSRLRHDFVMLGRAAVEPLPDALEARLGPAGHPHRGARVRSFAPKRGGSLRPARGPASRSRRSRLRRLRPDNRRASRRGSDARSAYRRRGAPLYSGVRARADAPGSPRPRSLRQRGRPRAVSRDLPIDPSAPSIRAPD